MKFILFLMFFTTAPAPPPAPGEKPPDKIWALQSTASLEFATERACKGAGAKVTASLLKTDTLTVRGWCFCESPVRGQCPKDMELSDKKTGDGFIGEGGSFSGQGLRPPPGK